MNESEAVPVEIHCLDAKYKRLPDRYLQEIIELLRETVISRLSHSKKKNVQPKSNKDSSGILTGTNVRVGFSFKNRPGHQMCIHGEDLNHLNVVGEKLIVFVQVLTPGSPKGMSQLLRRLSDVKHPAGPSVSISSYFQKMPLSQRSQGQGSGSTQGHTSGSKTSSQDQGTDVQHSSGDYTSLIKASTQDTERSAIQDCPNNRCDNEPEPLKSTDTPPSAGRRNKIKNILGRYRFAGKKKKRFNPGRITNSEDQDSCGSDKSSTTDKIGNNDSSSNLNSEENREVSRKGSCLEGNDDVDMNFNRISDQEISSDDIRVTELENFSSDEILDLDLKSKPCSITIDTNVNESQTFTVSKVEPQVPHDDSEFINLPSNVKRVSVDNIKLDIKIDSMDIDSVILNTGDKEEKLIDNDQVETETPPGLNDARSSSSDNSPLPSASFCYVKSNKRFSQIYGDALRDILNKLDSRKEDDLTEPGSPVFKGKSVSNKQDHEDTENIPEISNDVASKPDDSKNNKPPRRRMRKFKRKLPKFSDSDSEDSLPDSKRQNTTQVMNSAINKSSSLQKDKLSNLTIMKKDCKRLKISKDFFTENKPKSQPKLTFFNKNTKQTSQNGETIPAGSEKDKKESAEKVLRGTDEDFPDMDTELVEELSDIPRIKSEAEIEMLREVRSLEGVERLNEEQIRFLIRRNEILLRQIFEGKAKCERHQAYKAGGKARRDLIYASRLGPYTDEQIDVVMEYLISVFCKKHHKYFDYVMKVLLPEMLIQFHMEIHNTTHAESDRLLGPKSPVPLPTF